MRSRECVQDAAPHLSRAVDAINLHVSVDTACATSVGETLAKPVTMTVLRAIGISVSISGLLAEDVHNVRSVIYTRAKRRM